MIMTTMLKSKVMTIPRNNYFQRWLAKIRNRITKRNKNWLCVIIGETGTGKSWSGGRICELLDSNFIPAIQKNGIRSRVAIGKSGVFMKMLNSQKWNKGSMCMYDEAGVGASSRNWYKEANKAVNFVMQTFREMNLGVVFTVPDMSFIDKQIRKLLHFNLEAIDVHDKIQMVELKPKIMQNNRVMAKIYYKYPWIGGNRIERFWIRKPNPLFIEQYEPYHKMVKKQLRIEGEQEQEIEESKKQHRRVTDAGIMKDIKDGKAKRDAYELQFIYAIGKDRAYRILKNYDKYSPSL